LSGTIFESSKRPLTIWFRLIWDLVSKKNGINAKDLSNEINLNYHMVWISLHKLRRTLVQDKQTPLTGNVEIGEFLFGAFFDSPSYGRLQKVLTTVAMELKGEPLGKTRLQIVQSDKSLELLRFIHNNVKQGSSIITEDKNIYSKITSFGYTHVIQNPKNDKNALPHVQEVFSMFDEWILKILYYKRSAAKINLPYYFDEFAFLFNKRETKNIYLLFHQFFANAINFYPVTVKKFAMFLNLREAIYKH
jgi:hypothetical protein